MKSMSTPVSARDDRITELRTALESIKALCDAPHWNAARRDRVREIAAKAISADRKAEGPARNQ